MTKLQSLRALAGIATLALASAAAQATTLGSNLIVNGDAENGTTGWQTFSNTALFSSAAYSSNWVQPSEPGPVDRGVNLFVGDSGNAYAAGFQTTDVTDLALQIDSGVLAYSLSGWLGGWTTQADNAMLWVQFFGASNNELGTAALGPVGPADRGNVTGLILVSANGALPVGTRSVQFSLSMERLGGGDNDGYADNLAFSIQAVPEPQSAALLLCGLLAVGRLARRSRG